MSQLAVPTFMSKALSEVRRHPEMGAAIRALEERGEMDPLRAQLAGAGMVKAARGHMDAALDAKWGATPIPRNADEVVIGGGLHAAIYSAVRVASGAKPPLVLEASDRAGGAMGWGEFYLNSRNRAGSLSSPGRNGALNVLPAAALQPADLSAAEFQRSTELAYVVRSTLAMSARVRTGARATAIDFNYDTDPTSWRVSLSDGRTIAARRVVIATGLGDPLIEDALKLISFRGLMRRMDEPFPLRGLRSVAVIGAGDSGKTAVEALTGQGPGTGWSPASVDYVDRIDWYGVPGDRRTCDNWREKSRTRYKGIAGLLPRTGRFARVKPFDNASSFNTGYDMAFVNDRPYDLVVDCRGYGGPRSGGAFQYPDTTAFYAGDRIVGESYADNLVVVGPASGIALSANETVDFGTVSPESGTALFRYAERTAAAAAELARRDELVTA